MDNFIAVDVIVVGVILVVINDVDKVVFVGFIKMLTNGILIIPKRPRPKISPKIKIRSMKKIDTPINAFFFKKFSSSSGSASGLSLLCCSSYVLFFFN